MQIQAITPQISFAGFKKLNRFNTNGNFRKIPYAQDSFVKQNSETTTTAKKKENKQNNLGSSLSDIKIKGLPFLLGVVTSAAMVKMGEDASELLCDSDGYIVSEDGVFSDLVNIDLDEQILEFKGTGISINADDYDYVDWSNGIFRNHDGSVDINFGEGKFIDTINGIIVDPIHKVSGILDNGVMQSMAIPDFRNTSFGSGYPTGVVDDRWATLQQEYARRHPEMYEQKNLFEKAGEFLNGLFKKDSMPQVDGFQDIFGNEIIAAKDRNGDTYLASYIQKEIEENPIFAEFKTQFGKEAAVEKANGERMEQYIKENHPKFGTRILVYEGGRNATGSGWSRYNHSVADINKDRKVSPEELKKYLQSLSRDEKGNLDKEGTAKLLELFDKNQDGKITFEEILETLDLNKDGIVSPDEFLSIFDLNGDGTTTMEEIYEGIMKLIFRRF